MQNDNLQTFLVPKKMSDILGQEHLIGKNKFLTLMVEKQRLFSLILFGPPGVGKSTIAKILAQELKCNYQILHCGYDHKKEITNKLQLLSWEPEEKQILILEEIHRLNSDHQDLFLHLLEQKRLTIIATTTENPFFVLNPAIRSRTQLLTIKPIKTKIMLDHLQKLMNKQVISTKLTSSQINQIVYGSNGDFRFLINTLQKCHLLYPKQISDEQLEVLLGGYHYQIRGGSQEHHNLKSALQKSIRGSDVNASLYYLARLLVTGDLKTIVRRLGICAFEDIGLANMALCNRVIQGLNFANQVGLAEAYNILGPIVIEMALSPKSNSGSQALAKAQHLVQNNPHHPIPKHL